MDDYRLQWIKATVCKYLQIDDPEAFDELFENQVECAKSLYSFLAGSKESRCIFFYDTEEEIEVDVEDFQAEDEELAEEEEETVLGEEENKEQQPGDDEGEGDSNGGEEEEEDDSSDDDEEEEEEEDSTSSEAENPDEENVDEDEEEKDDDADDDDDETTEAEVAEKKKFMMQVAKKTVLHICLNVTEHVPGRRYVYLLLRKCEPIPFTETWEETVKIMQEYFEYGVINKHPVMNMLDVISLVYLPLLRDRKCVLISESEAEKMSLNELNAVHEQFLSSTENVSSQVSILVNQLQKPFPFRLPHVPPNMTAQQLADDSSFILEAEDYLKDWTAEMKKQVEEVTKKVPEEKNPFSEIRFWTEYRANLSALSDHLSNPVLNLVLKALQLVESKNLADFENWRVEMKRQILIAKDNLNHLHNLEPYLKDLRPDSPLESAIQAVAPVMNVYKLLWTLSDYYGRVDNMGRLIEGLGKVIEERISLAGNLKELFHKPFHEIKKTMEACKELAKEWNNAYYTQRALIETLEGMQHWYYSSKVLFERTDYMSTVCDTLAEICMKWTYQKNILKPELKMFTRDEFYYDKLSDMISELPKRLRNVDFDIFSPKNSVLWNNLVQWFMQRCSMIEQQAMSLISKIFKEESDFETAMLMTSAYGSKESSPAILDLIQHKYTDTLSRYLREVSDVEKQFSEGKDNPPKYKGYPTMTSTITWERHLLSKIKGPMIIFNKHRKFGTTEMEKKVRESYLNIAKELRKFEKDLFEKWKTATSKNIPILLQTALLKKDDVNPYYYRISDQAEIQRLKNTILSEMNYCNNFPSGLKEVMLNAAFLQQAGFSMPQAIRNFLSREEMYTANITALDITLHKLHTVLGSLSFAEAKLLEGKLLELKLEIDVGTTHLLWASLGIPQFISKIQKLIDCFRSLVYQVKGIGEEFTKKVNSFKEIQLFFLKKTQDDEDVPICQLFFSEAESRMVSAMEDHVKTYRSIVPLLYKIESLVFHSRTGCAKQMKEYYRKYEIDIVFALAEMVIENLELLSWSLESHIFPYFSALFNSTDPLVRASTECALPVFKTFLLNCVKSTAMFKRWMDGTCKEAPRQFIEDTNENFEYTYFSDVRLHPEVRKHIMGITLRVKNYIHKLQSSKEGS